MEPSLSPSAWRIGQKKNKLNCSTSNQANRHKMLISNASIARSVKMSWMHICLIIWMRFAKLQSVGWRSTTPFVRTRLYRVYRPASMHFKMPDFVYLSLVYKMGTVSPKLKCPQFSQIEMSPPRGGDIFRATFEALSPGMVRSRLDWDTNFDLSINIFCHHNFRLFCLSMINFIRQGLPFIQNSDLLQSINTHGHNSVT